MPEATILQLGNRLGTYVALMFFAMVFAFVGLATWREIRRRAPEHPRTAWVVGSMLFAGPTVSIYVSSLGGFYQVELGDRDLVLRYLHRPEIRVTLGEIEAIQVVPAFKGRWRLRVVRKSDATYDSAAGDRDQINGAAVVLRKGSSKLP